MLSVSSVAHALQSQLADVHEGPAGHAMPAMQGPCMLSIAVTRLINGNPAVPAVSCRCQAGSH